MCCIVALMGLVGPRVAFLFAWIFTDEVNQSIDRPGIASRLARDSVMRVPPRSSASVWASSSSSRRETLLTSEPSSASEKVMRSLWPER
mgnify:CR=1 FL=1